MSEYQVFINHNRNTFLQYRDAGKTRHYVTMMDGSIDCIQLSAKDYRGLKVEKKSTPEHFAEVYLKSHLSISRPARAILRAVLGESGDIQENPSDPRFSGSVTLEQIAEGNNWEPSRCRKFLRKLVDKPGGRWAWPPEEAEKITNILRECMSDVSA
jgi:hypothetical protein